MRGPLTPPHVSPRTHDRLTLSLTLSVESEASTAGARRERTMGTRFKGVLSLTSSLSHLSLFPMKRFLLYLFLATALIGCDSESDADTFRASLFDEADTLVLEGELRMDIESGGQQGEPREVTGTWRLGAPGGSDSSSGQLRGELLGSSMDVSLMEPTQDDAGYDLSGTYDGDRFAGTWSELTIAGPQPRGSFEAVRD